MKYALYCEGDLVSESDNVEPLIQLVQEHYAAYLADKAEFPSYYPEGDEFDFGCYDLTQEVDIDLEKVITTNKRGSMPKSYAGEGVNFID